jgi:hypothetical protein
MSEGNLNQEKPTSDLAEELKRLGQQLGVAAKAAWESESSRNMQTQLRDGLAEMARQLDGTAKKIAESEEAATLRAQAERVVESARKSDVASELQEGLLTGLREMNAALEKAIAKLRRSDRPSEPPAPPA